jgi:hypothetical protein
MPWGDKMVMDFKKEEEGWKNVLTVKKRVWQVAQICWVKGSDYPTTNITK